MKVICGLGNPGPEYAATRHNVGWWVLEHAQKAWGFTPFRRMHPARVSEGYMTDRRVVLVEPLTWMNRSGAAVAPLARDDTFDVAHDLLVVVDDSALDVGRIRFRAAGSAGGHNGLKSIEAALGTREYARLRIGVGAPPAGLDLADWVLSTFEEEDEGRILALLPELADAMRVWIEQGVEAAANRFNR